MSWKYGKLCVSGKKMWKNSKSGDKIIVNFGVNSDKNERRKYGKRVWGLVHAKAWKCWQPCKWWIIPYGKEWNDSSPMKFTFPLANLRICSTDCQNEKFTRQPEHNYRCLEFQISSTPSLFVSTENICLVCRAHTTTGVAGGCEIKGMIIRCECSIFQRKLCYINNFIGFYFTPNWAFT
jgi:hypothetical protein